jgi:hypothetical protein
MLPATSSLIILLQCTSPCTGDIEPLWLGITDRTGEHVQRYLATVFPVACKVKNDARAFDPMYKRAFANLAHVHTMVIAAMPLI